MQYAYDFIVLRSIITGYYTHLTYSFWALFVCLMLKVGNIYNCRDKAKTYRTISQCTILTCSKS